jgi:hypothetical protein
MPSRNERRGETMEEVAGDVARPAGIGVGDERDVHRRLRSGAA